MSSLVLNLNLSILAFVNLNQSLVHYLIEKRALFYKDEITVNFVV